MTSATAGTGLHASMGQLAICQTEAAGSCYDPALLPVGCRSKFAVSKRLQHDPALCNVFAGERSARMAEPISLRHSC